MPETTQFGGQSDPGYVEGALKANTVLMSRYRILGVAGGGGMGTVYQARDLHFPDAKRLVAIKEMQNINIDPSMRAAQIKTFQREANILATLSHPAIPKIFDFFDVNDRAYLIMEYINGNDLEMLLQKTRELPVEKVLDWAIELCDVLDYLHSHKPEPIMFRDMKPANIMIDGRGQVRLIDFGIAKIFVSGIKNTMIGTEGYSAPEQYKGDVTPVSDIYGLGATLHHILTRRDPRLEPPFSFHERSITELNPKCPPGFATIVDKTLALKPEERYQTCVDMKAALEAVKFRTSSAAAQGVTISPANSGSASGVPDSTSYFEDLPGGAGRGAIEPRWRFKTEDEIRGGMAVHMDMVYVGSYDTNLWALKSATGEFMWKYPTKGGIATTPAIDTANKLVLFGSEDNTFTALDVRTGRISWSYSTRGRVRGAPNVAHGHVFFGSDDGKLYALVAGNGRSLWEYDMATPVRVRPFVTNDLVIAASDAGDIIGLELSGKRKWSIRAKRGINSSPMVDMKENICYIGSFDGFVYALDATSGYTLWRFRTAGPIIAQPVLEEGTLYFGSADGSFYAVNAETGRERWRFILPKPIVATAAVHLDKVYFGATDNNFYCLDIRTGKEMWHFETRGQITGAPLISENVILIGSMDKTLYALPLVK